METPQIGDIIKIGSDDFRIDNIEGQDMYISSIIDSGNVKVLSTIDEGEKGEKEKKKKDKGEKGEKEKKKKDKGEKKDKEKKKKKKKDKEKKKNNKDEMDDILTGNPGTDLNILSQLDDQEVDHLCQTSKYTHNLCTDDFWRLRLIDKFGREISDNKPNDMTHHQYYRILTQYARFGTVIKNSIISAIYNRDYAALEIMYENFSNIRDDIIKLIVEDYTELRPELMNQIISNESILDGLKSEAKEIIEASINMLDLHIFLAFLNEFDDYDRDIFLDEIIHSAITKENNDIIDELFVKGLINGSDVTDVLFIYGHSEDLIQDYLDNLYNPTQESEFKAIEMGNLEALKRLNNWGFPPTTEGKNYAQDIRDLNIVSWYNKMGV